MPDRPPHYRVSRTYDDFDVLAEEAQQWDLDLRQLDAGQFRGDILQFGIDDVHISEARFGRVLKQGGSPPAGLRTIAVPGNEEVALKWRGSHVCGNSLMIFPEGAELDAVSDSRFHVFTCSFPESLLANLAEHLEIDPLRSSPDGQEVVRCGSNQMQRLRGLLHAACSQMAPGDPTLQSEFAETITWELPALLLKARLDADQHSTSVHRSSLLRRAEEIIEQRADEAVTVTELCQALGASLRTVQYAFAEEYGISPKAYIRAIRLNRVRKGLLAAASQEQRVADVANRFGFWHMGQFAADYRKQFGELPSKTLKSRATHAFA